MTVSRQLVLPLLALLAGAGVAHAATLKSSISPVTRVVELLEHLSKDIESDGKKEEDLYETFVCWAKSIISQKTASNEASTSRIDMLKQYISDLDSGRIELTTERVDLEKEIEQLTGEIEVATETRKKENEDYLEAKDEMDKAIAALEKAIGVLKTATEDHTEGVLLSISNAAGEGYSQRAMEASQLKKAADLGEKVLTKGDALFLRRLLTGEVPKADWKKLNRKATFKMDYKARSFKIQGVLAKLLETFSGNLEDATAAEEEALATFNKLMKSKNGEKDAATTALDNLAGENGAKAMSREESVDEKERLEAEVENDTEYIKQVKASLAEKKSEWKDRKALRAAEIAAISKAINILHSDDSRDLFKKSFASQDKSAFLLQEGSMSASQMRRQLAAVQLLRETGRLSADSRLSALAARLSSGNHFDEVIDAIDRMLRVLEAEEKDDLEKKETCEQDRADDTRVAAKLSREIDVMSDSVAKLKYEIKELAKEIADKQVNIEEIEKQLKEAKTMRGEENAEFLKAKKDDEDAATLVMNAKNVLASFYEDNNLVFAQKAATGKGKQPFESVAGEAPPPPPTTWDAPYGGKTGESQGIVAVLQMIYEDINKDIAKATKEEGESLAMYEDTKKSLDDEVLSLTGQINEANSTISGKEDDVVSTEGVKATAKGELKATMKKMEDIYGFCAYFVVNYPLRLKNRQIEMDGLSKAKAILKGAAFSGLQVPKRSLRAGRV